MIEFTGMQPVVAVEVLARDLDYYVTKLGFEIGWQWGEPPVRAGVVRDGFELQLVADPRFSPACASRIYFVMRGVDAYYSECVDRGVTVETEIGDRSFGMRDFRVMDHSGNILGFGEPTSSM